MKTLPTQWPFPTEVKRGEDQRAAAITGECIALIDNVTMPRNPSAGRRPPKPRSDAKLDASTFDAPF